MLDSVRPAAHLDFQFDLLGPLTLLLPPPRAGARPAVFKTRLTLGSASASQILILGQLWIASPLTTIHYQQVHGLQDFKSCSLGHLRSMWGLSRVARLVVAYFFDTQSLSFSYLIAPSTISGIWLSRLFEICAHRLRNTWINLIF